MQNQKSNIKYLELDEVRRIAGGIKLRRIRDWRDRAIIETLFSTGLRVAELVDLPEAPFVGASGQTLELSITGKGGYQRTIYFSPRALEAVKGYLVKKFEKGQDQEDTRLFALTTRAVEYVVKKRGEKVGISCHPHMLRHSFATDLMDKDVDLRIVQEFLGHRSIASTQVYTHVKNSKLKDIHSKLYK